MSVVQYLKQCYTLETLDTRFTIPSNVPPRRAAPDPGFETASTSTSTLEIQEASSRATGTVPRAKASQWNTFEYYIYYAVVCVAVFFMFKSTIDVSKSTHPNYGKYERLLSNGWFFGRKVDNSDAQYASFRDNFPYMVLLIIAHPILRKYYDKFCRADTYTKPSNSSNGLTQGLSAAAAADARLEQRISFDIIFSGLLITVLHGFSAFKIVLILYLNYSIAKRTTTRYIPLATWTFNIGLLFANEYYKGYSYARIWNRIFPPPLGLSVDDPLFPKNFGASLDSYGGLVSRWEVLFNITVLRLISFNMDYYWSKADSGGESPIHKKGLDPSNLSERDRVKIPARVSDYNFSNYFAYALYAPLYLTGPIITFNDFLSQLRYRSPSITKDRTIMYGVRFVVVLLTMEIMIHFMYMVAIFHAKPDWSAYTPFQLSMLGYFNLNHIWLKLLIPWRFFRLWALVDGIDPPENMVRCMSDNYSALAFWRGWHRSFNRWIVRYIYVPIGGSGFSGRFGQVRSIANFLAVFTFVALWHDIQLRLLMWGWLITLFVIPEIMGTLVFPARRWKDWPHAYRRICAAGATLNILMMMAANLVGFAIGVDGLVELLKAIFSTLDGLVFISLAMTALFMASNIMFEIREGELRKGIRMKC
ncbi:MBOAT-domain-containing protein [Pseudovirgaria hyperparasitica]|uniref:MBOAT-domain-containing protein n=1 Tax=Pseudovirgaria hyperparasitica TaxID=470096 RepID=A0A6A6W5K6_9PEZI|nr:MBOAT-domain-containing protein [Pseudovirgaria hyperparasitica]KAF2758162.1 MBOAT-domain-containing protein [Pseudovirgaria hyperparasitica]